VRWERPAGRLLFLLAGVVLVAVGLILAFAPPGWSIGTLAGDDAGYYLGIARNHALGYGYSFDRLHATNGFNPLFPWMLIAVFRLLPASLPLAACYHVAVLIGYAAMVVALVPFLMMLGASLDVRVFSGGLRHLALGAGAAFFALFIATKGYYGMDAPLVLALGLLYTWRVHRRGPLAAGAGAAAIDGLLLGLAFLARVDTLPLLAAAFAVMAFEWAASRRGGRGLAARLAVTSLVCLPYVLWSTARFGTWLPVSARLKSSFPMVNLGGSLHVLRYTSLHPADQASFLVAWMLAAGTGVVFARHVASARRARTPLDPRLAALGLLALYLIGRLTYMVLFSRGDVQGSYAILAHPFNVFVLASATGALAARAQGAAGGAGSRLPAASALGLALLSLLLFASKVHSTPAPWSRSAGRDIPDEVQLGREIHDLTRPGDVLYGGTFGMLGFFTDRAWINLDGVVNTYAYQRVFIEPGPRGQGGLVDYLRANHVSHVVVTLPADFHPGPGPIRLSAWGILYDRKNEFEVWPADILLRRPAAGRRILYVARYRP
jgi:hypothetical protein